jgi:hypothetical protein
VIPERRHHDAAVTFREVEDAVVPHDPVVGAAEAVKADHQRPFPACVVVARDEQRVGHGGAGFAELVGTPLDPFVGRDDRAWLLRQRRRTAEQRDNGNHQRPQRHQRGTRTTDQLAHVRITFPMLLRD